MVARSFARIMTERSLETYLRDIGRISLLTREQEYDLARRIREGDEEAAHDLVRANLRFVVTVAKQYLGQGLSLEDLINEGNIGLMKAATRFDERRGYKFISYAVWWVRQAILQAISTRGFTRPSGVGTVTTSRPTPATLAGIAFIRTEDG